MQITGTIESIEYRNNSGHEKKVVTVNMDKKQCAFVEFRGFRMEDLESYKVNDEVSIDVSLKGNTSRNTGIQYNNLVAFAIRKA